MTSLGTPLIVQITEYLECVAAHTLGLGNSHWFATDDATLERRNTLTGTDTVKLNELANSLQLILEIAHGDRKIEVGHERHLALRIVTTNGHTVVEINGHDSRVSITEVCKPKLPLLDQYSISVITRH